MVSSIPQAAANWTVGQLQGLIPANWTVTAVSSNRTSPQTLITAITCDRSAGIAAAFYQCAERLGHTRGECWGEINGTTVCSCSGFSGWDSCNEARCTYGSVSGCATPSPYYTMNVVFCSIALVLVTFTLAYALSTVWKGRAMCSRNVTNTTLAWLTLKCVSLFGWYGSVFVGYVVMRSAELPVRPRETDTLPMNHVRQDVNTCTTVALTVAMKICAQLRLRVKSERVNESCVGCITRLKLSCSNPPSTYFVDPPPTHCAFSFSNSQTVFQKPAMIPAHSIFDMFAIMSFPLM